jgi:hypothetical protein
VSVIDLSPGVLKSQQHLAKESAFDSVIKDNQWELMAKNHTKLIIDKNFDFQSDGETPIDARIFSENWLALAQFAVDHSMSINFGYAGRPINAFVNNEDIRIAKELSSGKLDKSAIYLISNEKDWTRYRDAIGDNGRALVLDGFFIIVGQ